LTIIAQANPDGKGVGFLALEPKLGSIKATILIVSKITDVKNTPICHLYLDLYLSDLKNLKMLKNQGNTRNNIANPK
jgi:hypothetical protein